MIGDSIDLGLLYDAHRLDPLHLQVTAYPEFFTQSEDFWSAPRAAAGYPLSHSALIGMANILEAVC